MQILNVCILYFIPGFYGDYNQSTDIDAYPGHDVVLPCQLAINSTKKRWLKESSILFTGREINKEFPSHERLSIDINYKEKRYNLQITNVRESDYGEYECIIQNDQEGFKNTSKITLKRQGMNDIHDILIISSLLYYKQ